MHNKIRIRYCFAADCEKKEEDMIKNNLVEKCGKNQLSIRLNRNEEH